MKYCNNCGSVLSDNAILCNNCGRSCNASSRINNMKTKYNSGKNNTYAIVGFIFSLVGLSIPGLALSCFGISKANECNGKGKGLAIAGMVISIVMCVLSMVGIYLYCDYLFNDKQFELGYDKGYKEGYSDALRDVLLG